MGAQAVRLSNVDIDKALKDRDFEVLFQPIFDLGNGALARVETFIRWRHPSLGVLPPGAFISFFETQGRMSELTRYVLAEALDAYQNWRGSAAPGFSINLALSDLSDESFASHFTVLLRERGFPAELVTLECPMPAVDADINAVARQLQRLGETGARLAIEVRGRANDFLKSVRPFPFAEIKTGGAAILRFARTVRGPGLSAISELLELAAEQNAAITAVGVEDQASLAALRGLGFAAAQGNHLGKVGALSAFMPSHVNEVRALLGLEPLSSDDLVALFRTGAPKLAEVAHPAAEEEEAGAPQATVADAAPAEEERDELVERLAARIARAETPPPAPADAFEDEAAARAAAIARARRKSRIREKIAAKNELRARAEARAAAQADTRAPRDLQERLSREFEAYADNPRSPEDADAARRANFSAGREDEVEGVDDLRDETLVSARDEDEMSAPDEAAPEADQETAPDRRAEATAAQQSHLVVPNPTARFTPTIRVSQPEARFDEVLGDLGRVEAIEDEASISTAPAATGDHPAAQAGAARDLEEDEIPPVRESAAWIEETVALDAAPEEPAPTRRRSFLTRTIIPYSALKITHFWPRFMRRRRAAAE